MDFFAKRGKFSQFSNCFDYPRQQCFGMATTAVVYGKSSGIYFENFDVDLCLLSGDRYYRACLQEMQKLAPNEVQLCSDNLLSPVQINGRFFQVERSDIADDITKPYTTGTLTVETLIALREAFEDDEDGGYTFTTQGMTVGVWKRDRDFFLFDSHSVNAEHYLMDSDVGAAHLYKTSSLENLAALLCRIYNNNINSNWLQMVRVFGVQVPDNVFVSLSITNTVTAIAQSRPRKRPIPGVISSTLLILATPSGEEVNPLEPKSKRFKPKKKSATTKAKENANRRLSMSQDQKQLRLTQERIRITTVREKETDHQRADRLLRIKTHMRSARERETDQQKADHLLREKVRINSARQRETDQQKADRLDKAKTQLKCVRESETDQQKVDRQAREKIHKTSVREGEQNNEKTTRRHSDRLRHRVADINRQLSFNNDQCNSAPNTTVTAFEKFQKQFDWADCSECLERFPFSNGKSGVCTRCTKYKKTDKINPFSSENSMDPGDVPSELKDLSLVEEQLIAMVHPVISVYRIRGQQYGYSGHVINFPQQVSDITKTLPRSIGNLSSILIVRKESANGYIDFRVRRERIRRALLYLKQNNRYYRDVQIDDIALNAIPKDSSLLDMDPQMLIEPEDDNQVNDCDVITTDVPNLIVGEPLRQIKSILDGDPETILWPKLGAEPINEFSTVGYVAMAFPTLFPLGAADLREPRQIRVTPSDYFQHLIKYKDGRFAKHPRFRFFAMNSNLRWAALQNGKICVQKNSELHNVNAASIKEKLLKNPKLIKKVLCFNSSLRGTSAYWHARCGELLDMVQQLGPPTIFFTLSAADIHWPEICRLLDPGIDYSKLGKSEANKRRNSILNDNPVIVAWFFANRADFFIKSVIVPELKVQDFWYRTEYQHRGSPHIHGVLWLDGAPDVRILDTMDEISRQSVCDYFDQLIKTVNPLIGPIPPVHPCQIHYSDVSNHDEDYINLINCVQMHTKHGPQCMRINKRSGVEECRFKFPFPLVENTYLTKDSGHWELVTARNHPLVNRHNRYITEHWRANTDVQPVLSINAVLNYIAKYASKAEPRSKNLKNLLDEALKKDDDSAQTAIQKLFVRMVAERDFSAQETAQILMGWPLYHCSRGFVTVNVDEKQWVAIGSTESLGSNSSSYDNYPLRSKEHENMSLLEHASNFYKKGESWVKRRTPSVVRIFPKKGKDQGEAYFRQQVLIHVPWRSVETFSSQGTWEHLYHVLVDKSDRTLVLPRVEEEYADIEEDNEALNVVDEWMVAAGIGPNGFMEAEAEMGMREFDFNHSWGEAFHLFNDPLNLPRFIHNEKIKDEECLGDEIWDNPVVTLSNEQNKVLHFVEERIRAIQLNDELMKPHMMIVQGKAGSGKSTVIKAVCAKLYEKLGLNSFRLMAPTGAAAVNVAGSTIHSALHLGVEKEFRKMGDENLIRFQESMRECHFIIIDEFSMVGCSLLKKIDLRCREAKPLRSNLPFGGMTLFLLGDIKQLPPVLDRPVYGTGFSCMLADQGQLIYKTIISCVVLSASFRQGGENQAVFRDILDRLSMGKSTKSDWEKLMAREKSSLRKEELELFSECMRLFPENKSVNTYNFEKLKSLNQPTAKVPAEHNNNEAARACVDRQAQGLEKTIYLCVGCRVMLKTNLWVKKGLVNGSLGTVTHLVYAPDCSPPTNRPLVIMVKFDNYTGPDIMGSVPIGTVTRTWRSGEVTCSRTQFPLILAWAVTIHKSQGLTLPRMVVDIGSRELAAGCSYVALSRSRRLADIVLEPFNLDRLTRIGTMKNLVLRVEEEERLNRLNCSL